MQLCRGGGIGEHCCVDRMATGVVDPRVLSCAAVVKALRVRAWCVRVVCARGERGELRQ